MPDANSSEPEIRTNLPRQIDVFVGREMELQKLLEVLGPSRRAWIISLTGVGGIGKTELAIQAAHIAAEKRMFDRIVWTSAKRSWLTHEGVTVKTPEYALVSLDDLLNTIIKVLGMDPRLYLLSRERKLTEVQEALRGCRCLIVVDNLETVDDLAIIQFLVELPDPSKALVTTRLGGLGTTDAVVAQTLEGQREIRVGPLTEDDAVDMFVKRAALRDLHFVSSEDQGRVRVAATKAACIPLAIEWIIGQMVVARQSLEEAVARLRSPGGEVLKYCFENLVRAVGPRARKVLSAIPIFDQSVSPDALSAVTRMPRGHLDDALRRLTSASLVELGVDGRYSVLAPTRLYVTAAWKQTQDLYEEYLQKAARYYVQLLSSVGKRQLWGTIENEQHNVMAIITSCFEGGHYELVVDLAHQASEYLQRIGLWDQRAHVCELATLAAANLGDKREAISFTYDAAEIHKHRGRLDQALEEFQRCEEFSRDIGDRVRAAHARTQVGVVYYHKGRFVDALKVLRQSLEMHEANEDRLGVGMVLNLLGRVERETGNLSAARKDFEEGLNLKKQAGEQLGAAIDLYDLGHTYHRLGDYQMAEQLLTEAQQMLGEIGDRRHLANTLWYLALLKIDRNELLHAKRLLQDVLSVEEALQRDTRVDRVLSKLVAVEEALKSQETKRDVAKQPGLGKPDAVRQILCVGIEHYQNMSAVPKATKDAEDILAALSRSLLPGRSRSHFLVDEAATVAGIRRKLHEVSELSRLGEAPIVVFTCHAVRHGIRNYLCAYDTDLNDLEGTALDGAEFAAILRDFPNRASTVILDCQHGTQATSPSEGSVDDVGMISGLSPQYLAHLASTASTRVLVSCDEGQISHKLTHMENGLFTHFLLKGLGGEACLRGDDLIHLLDLHYYIERGLQRSVTDQVSVLYPQPHDQTFVLCPISRSDSVNQRLELGIVDEAKRLAGSTAQTATFRKVTASREAIVQDPIKGAGQLSEYLTGRNAELRNQVDLHRSQLLRIQSDREKWVSLDPSQETAWNRHVFALLAICQSLLETEIDA